MPQSQTLTVTFAPQSALATAISALLPGQSASFSGGTSNGISSGQWDWQHHFEPVPALNIVHAMGKDAGLANSWVHRVYDILANSWTTYVNISTSGWPGSGGGHVYGNVTANKVSGDLYCVAGIGTNQLLRFSWTTKTWSVAVSTLFSGAPFQDPINGIYWHPDLFGPGQSGVVCNSRTDQQAVMVVYYRESNGQVTRVQTAIQAGKESGGGAYHAGTGRVILGGESETSGSATPSNHLFVVPNATVGGTPVASSGGAPPIKTGGDSRLEARFGSYHQHPSDNSRMVLLERNGGSSRRVWTSTTGGTPWTLKSYAHAFDGTSRGIAIAPILGALWALGSGYSVIWKPGD